MTTVSSTIRTPIDQPLEWFRDYKTSVDCLVSTPRNAQADAPVQCRSPKRQNQRVTATNPAANASVPSSVETVKRPVKLSAGTVTAKATGIRKVSERRN